MWFSSWFRLVYLTTFCHIYDGFFVKSPINKFKKYHSRSPNLILNVKIFELFRGQKFFIASFKGDCSEVHDRYPSKDVISVSIKSSFVSVLTKYACDLNMTYLTEFCEPIYKLYIFYYKIWNYNQSESYNVRSNPTGTAALQMKHRPFKAPEKTLTPKVHIGLRRKSFHDLLTKMSTNWDRLFK